jgi:hypothetical protein
LWAAVVTGGLAFLGTIAVAWIARGNRRIASDVAAEILDELKTGNDHTVGQAVSRVEDRLYSVEQLVDRIEVRQDEQFEIVREHIADSEELIRETGPMRAWLTTQYEEREGG